jgi:hypothetical protein
MTASLGADVVEAPKVAQNRATQAGITTCPRCSKHWGGLKTAHCTACHETFTVVSTFDKHRTGSHPLSTRTCVDPATVGLVDAGRAYPCWGSPGDGRFDNV